MSCCMNPRAQVRAAVMPANGWRYAVARGSSGGKCIVRKESGGASC